jgi:hypothetical protein
MDALKKLLRGYAAYCLFTLCLSQLVIAVDDDYYIPYTDTYGYTYDPVTGTFVKTDDPATGPVTVNPPAESVTARAPATAGQTPPASAPDFGTGSQSPVTGILLAGVLVAAIGFAITAIQRREKKKGLAFSNHHHT